MGMIFLFVGIIGFGIGWIIGPIFLVIYVLKCLPLKQEKRWIPHLIFTLGIIGGFIGMIWFGIHCWSLITPGGSGEPTTADYLNIMKSMFFWGLSTGGSLLVGSLLSSLFIVAELLLKANRKLRELHKSNDSLSNQTCPKCHLYLSQKQVDTAHENPKCKQWMKDGYCSQLCFESDKKS